MNETDIQQLKDSIPLIHPSIILILPKEACIKLKEENKKLVDEFFYIKEEKKE